MYSTLLSNLHTPDIRICLLFILLQGVNLYCGYSIPCLGCMNGEKPKWHKYPNHILLGHNFDRLENVITAQECQKLCYRDKKCRSIDYVR